MSDPAVKPDANRVAVFISYSRKDFAAADRLCGQLIAAGFDAYLDRHDILPGEPWQERIGQLIEHSDTVIFLVSPDSTGSEICDWEINEAERLQKRILPVVIRDTPDAAVPGRLRRLNYVFLRDAGEQAVGLETLAGALRTDIDWVREHTRLGALAADWQRNAHAREFLLRGAALAAAELWVSAPHFGDKAPTELHRAFISASRENEQARAQAEREQIARTRRLQKRAAWALAGLALLLAAGAAATLWQTRETAKREAVVLSSAAQKALDAGYYQRAARIALAGLPKADDISLLTPWSLELEAKLSSSQFRGRNFIARMNHKGALRGAIFNHDGTRVLTFSEDGTAKLWDGEQGTELAVLPHGGIVSVGTFSRDGSRVLTLAHDKKARLWDGVTGRLIAELGEAAVAFPLFSPDGSRILTKSDDRTLRLWESGEGRPIAALRHGQYADTAKFSPDGTRVLTTDYDKTVRLWSSSDGRQIVVITDPADVGLARLAAFSPDGAYMLTYAGPYGRVRLFRPTDGGEIATVPNEEPLGTLLFSPDGTRLLTMVSTGGFARLWDVARAEQIALMQMPVRARSEMPPYPPTVMFSPDGRRILMLAEQNAALLWDGLTGRHIATVRHERTIWHGTFSPDGKRFVTSSFDNTARVWEAEDGAAAFAIRHEGVSQSLFTPDGRRILTRTEDSAKLWDATTGAEIASMRHEGRLNDIGVSPDSTRVLTSSADGTAQLWHADWRANAGYLLTRKTAKTGAFSRDGTRLLAQWYGEPASVWDVATGTRIATLTAGDENDEVRLSADGTRVLSFGRRATGAYLWDAGRGTRIATLLHGDEIFLGAFSDDGSRIVTFSRDKALHIWNSADGSSLQVIQLDEFIDAPVLSPDGARMLITNAASVLEHTVQLWGVAAAKSIATLQLRDGLEKPVFSPDGSRIVTRGRDNGAGLWDGRTGAAIAVMRHNYILSSAEFSSDGRRVLTIAFGPTGYNKFGGTVRLWNAADGAAIAVLREGPDPARAAFSSNGKRLLVTGGTDAIVRDSDDGAQVAVLHHGSPVIGGAISPDGTRVVTNTQNEVKLWDGVSGREIAVLSKESILPTVSFSPDGALIALRFSGSVRIRSAQSGSELAVLDHGSVLSDIKFSEGSNLLVPAQDATWLWRLEFMSKTHGTPLRDDVCGTRLTGAQRITVGDAGDPIVQGRDGSNVCATGPLSIGYWTTLARGLWTSAAAKN